jgi:soluble lytic murein transglycosylase-like protein
MRWMCVLLPMLAMAQTPPAPVPVHMRTAAELMRASLDKQREAVRKQAQDAGASLIPWSPGPFDASPAAAEPAAPLTCDALSNDVVTPLIESAAKDNSLPATMVRAVIEQESGYRPCAVSPKGAQGLMQLMPDTANQLSVKDIFDPRENIAAGVKYLKQLVDKYKGDNKLALAAYNAGPAAVDAANGVPDIQETRDYVDAIIKKIR